MLKKSKKIYKVNSDKVERWYDDILLKTKSPKSRNSIFDYLCINTLDKDRSNLIIDNMIKLNLLTKIEKVNNLGINCIMYQANKEVPYERFLRNNYYSDERLSSLKG